MPDQMGLLTLDELAALAQAPQLPPEKQWWNLRAKVATGRQIADEEARKFDGQHNNAGDALRLAEWSQRMTTDVGPIFSGLVGLGHEADNVAHAAGQQYGKALAFFDGDPKPYNSEKYPSVPQTLSESGMDLWNNAQGIAAGLLGRPIDPASLVTTPVIPGYRR